MRHISTYFEIYYYWHKERKGLYNPQKCCDFAKCSGSPTSVPALTTDTEAEAFLAQDLSTLDFSQFKPLRPGTRPNPAPVRKKP